MLTYVIVAVGLIWLTVVSLVLYNTKKHYRKLVSKTKKGTIGEVLESLLKNDDVFSSKVAEIERNLNQLEYKEKLHYQKIGFLRFNPFERVGGEQSFILTLLNSEDTGIVLNFLYTREGIRVFAKRVNKGVGKEYELSSEEKEAINKAQ